MLTCSLVWLDRHSFVLGIYHLCKHLHSRGSGRNVNVSYTLHIFPYKFHYTFMEKSIHETSMESFSLV